MLDLQPAYARAAHDAIHHFRPLINVIAAIAHGDETRRAEVEYLLPQLDNNGWTIEHAVKQIWAGERDETTLTAGHDPNTTALLRAILRAVSEPVDPDEARLSKIIGEWRPVILTVAAATLDVDQARQDVEGFLPQLEASEQWQTLAQRMRLLLAGDHNRDRLLAGLDPTDTVIMSSIFHALDDQENLIKLVRAERDRATAEEQ